MSVSNNAGTVVFLTEDDIRELAWVADVLEHYADSPAWTDSLRAGGYADLAGVIRSKLPEPRLQEPTRPGAMVCDKNGAFYVTFGDHRWYLMGTGPSDEVLEVPWESILDPYMHFDGYRVVE